MRSIYVPGRSLTDTVQLKYLKLIEDLVRGALSLVRFFWTSWSEAEIPPRRGKRNEQKIKFCANTWSAALKVSLRIHNSPHNQCRVVFKTLSAHI